ncbi:MAG: MazG nucleotide pyrophosphohydrolase domain-containing protein [Tissierellia bacterium]|nr:MazG nucleotide pyrophosphohydrolase domain-containing protein [Tissierellia bacterium]
MGKIRIVGLGPTDEGDLTQRAMDCLLDDTPKILRTDHHDSVAFLKKHRIPYTTYEYLYESKDDFQEIYSEIADDLLKRAASGDVTYCVPGHPLIAEQSVLNIMEKTDNYEMINGMSFLEPVLTAVGRDPISGLKLIDGDNFSDLDLDIHVDSIVTQVYNQRIASSLKLALSERYGDEHPVAVLEHAGSKRESVRWLPVYELDRNISYGHETSLFVPKGEGQDLRSLVEVARSLRGPGGCPWDQKQTHASMKQNVIEEAYEVVEAIEEDDPLALEEELGDLLFQVVLHSEIAREEGDFTLESVSARIAEKLIRRHPHVFQGHYEDWETIKGEETGRVQLKDKLTHYRALPALLHGQKALRLLMREGKIDDFQEFLQNYPDPVARGLVQWIYEAEKSDIDTETAVKKLLHDFTCGLESN